MPPIVALAIKDLRVLSRIRMALFFTVVWPVIVAVMFGYAFGGDRSDGPAAIQIALVDEDATAGSQRFAARLEASGHFAFTPMTRDEAVVAVRTGRLAAYFVLPDGFGERSEQLFGGTPREIEVGADPARRAEAAMIEGLLMQAAAREMQETLADPAATIRTVDRTVDAVRDNPKAPRTLLPFLEALKTFVGDPGTQAGGPAGPGGWAPLVVRPAPVMRDRRAPVNAFQVTFPQGILWALIGCAMSFGQSLVHERARGTFVRLAMSPLTRGTILGGKALACATAMGFVQAVLYLLGVTVFGMTPSSWLLLAVASLSATAAFCGLMMLIATLGATEQTASGTAWAILMPLTLAGGGMIPQFLMPPWLLAIGTVSPMKWAILAIEGALWRGFTAAEMVLPCAILLSVGVLSFTIGARRLRVG
jgi:ABC-2 type transport system permease protein